MLISLYRSDVSNTCPICRDEIHGNKDFWEVPETPSKTEIGNFVLVKIHAYKINLGLCSGNRCEVQSVCTGAG